MLSVSMLRDGDDAQSGHKQGRDQIRRRAKLALALQMEIRGDEIQHGVIDSNTVIARHETAAIMVVRNFVRVCVF